MSIEELHRATVGKSWKIPDYSFRSATIGCTPAARRAGINDANSAARATATLPR
jgi:hypothetical protein